jgi:arsenate reductase (glutaredoxin)
MLKIYGIANCDTMKKAMNWLTEHNLAYEFHNYKKEGVSEAKIKEWLTQQPIDKLINKAGQTYKKLSDSEKPTNETKAIALMLDKTSAIKRPIIEKNGKIIILGFDIVKYQEVFGS